MLFYYHLILQLKCLIYFIFGLYPAFSGDDTQRYGRVSANLRPFKRRGSISASSLLLHNLLFLTIQLPFLSIDLNIFPLQSAMLQLSHGGDARIICGFGN